MFDPKKYPQNWKQISQTIRGRSGGQCECEGECGLHNGTSLFSRGKRRCEERNGAKAKWAKGKVVLTVAHLNRKGDVCTCQPYCGNPAHLKAMCQRCHNRYDMPMRQMHAQVTRERKRRS